MDPTLAQDIVVVVAVGAATLVTVPWMLDVVELSNARVKHMDPNSDEKALAWFLLLLRQASTEVVMFDDGDTSPGSLYQRQEVIDAIRGALDRHPNLKIRCLLTHRRHETSFEQTFDDHPRVSIGKRSGPRSSVHYKMFDGKIGYISRHAPMQTARKRLLIDCSRPAARRRTGGRPLALSPYYEDFERHYAAA